MSVEGKYFSENTADELIPGTVVECERLYVEGRRYLKISEYLGTNGDETVTVHAQEALAKPPEQVGVWFERGLFVLRPGWEVVSYA